jgi:PPOX class probable F420-dependent enzyme
MSATLPPKVKELFEGKNFGHVTTLMPDGSPQVTAVWVNLEGDTIVFNTAEGRQKPRNMRRDPRVAVSIVDQDNPYTAAFVRGKVVEITPEGGDAHIDSLAKKYMDADTYPFRQEGEVRLIVKIEPHHVSGMGID